MKKSQGSECHVAIHQHCVESWQSLAKLWKAGKLCDVVVNVKGKLFACHSVVAASASPFFRKALSKTKHKAAYSEKEIFISFITPELFNQVLHFMYTAEIRVNQDSARSLILAAGRLEMQIMINAIMQKILKWELENCFFEDGGKRRLKKGKSLQRKSSRKNSQEKLSHNRQSVERDDFEEQSNGSRKATELEKGSKPSRDRSLTVTGVMDELRIQGDLTTLKKVRVFAARNFAQISQLGSFLEASVHTLASLLGDERIKMREVEIFLALCKWLEAQTTHMINAPFLLSKIRLRLLSPSELAEHVETKDYLMQKKKSRVQVLEAFRYHCLQSQSSDHKQYYSNEEIQAPKPRKGAKEDYVTEDEESEDEDDKLVKEENFCKSQKKEDVSTLKYIILSGGIDVKETTASDAVYKYEEAHNWWVRFSRMPEHRNHHAAVFCNGTLYILGGSDPSLTGREAEVCPVSTCYKMELSSLKWNKIESMSIPRMSLQSAVLGDHIYAIGGQDHKQRVLRDTERYCISTGEWEHSGSLLSSRAGLAVCKFNNKLWALGGYCHKKGIVLDEVEVYNEEHKEWETMPSLRFPRCFANVATCQRHIYVVGGAWLDPEIDCCNFSSVYDVDVYNSYSKVWEGIATMKIGRHDAGIAVLGPKIYIIGGKHCDEGKIRNLDSVECFDVGKNRWIDGIKSLPLPLLGPAVT